MASQWGDMLHRLQPPVAPTVTPPAAPAAPSADATPIPTEPTTPAGGSSQWGAMLSRLNRDPTAGTGQSGLPLETLAARSPMEEFDAGGEFGAMAKVNGVLDGVMVALNGLALGGDEGKEALREIGHTWGDIGGGLIHGDLARVHKGLGEAVLSSELYGPGGEALNTALATKGAQGLAKLLSYASPAAGALAIGGTKALGQFNLDHPWGNAAEAFFVELFNPAYLATGEVFGAGSRLLKGAGGVVDTLARSPWTARAMPTVYKFYDESAATIAKVPRTVRSWFDAFSGLASVDAAAEGIMRAGMSLLGHGDSRSLDHVMRIFGPDLTLDQQRQVVRESQLGHSLAKPGDIKLPDNALPGQPKTPVPEPAGLTLAQRGAALRTFMKALDRLQISTDPELLPKNRQFDSDKFFPMPRRPDELVDQLDESAGISTMPTGGGGFKVSRGTAGTSGPHKYYGTLAERELHAPETIPTDWSPADELHNHVRGKLRAVFVTKTLQQMQRLGLLAPKSYIYRYAAPAGTSTELALPGFARSSGIDGVTTRYVPESNQIEHNFGQGLEGYKRAQKFAEKHGEFFAQTNSDLIDRYGFTAKPRRAQARMQQTRGRSAEARQADRVVQRISGRTAAGTLKDMHTLFSGGLAPGAVMAGTAGSRGAADFSLGQMTKMHARAKALWIAMQQQVVSEAQKTAYLREFGRIADESTHSIMDRIVSQTTHHEAELGRKVYQYDPRIHSPILQHSSLHPELYKFLVESGAPPSAAASFGRWIDTINRWQRVGIISNPIVHVAWNLSHAYLAAGGDIKFFGMKLWQPMSSARYMRALRGGAIAVMPTSRSMLNEGSVAKLLTTSPRDLSTKERVDRYLTTGWKRNQDFVFHTMEARMAVDLFERYAAKGYTDLEAGQLVRKALGDYANVSPVEKALQLNRLFFFYPWMKTVIPFWTSVEPGRLKMINAPMTATRAYNQSFGYDTPGGEQDTDPYALHIGGSDSPLVMPFPERYFGVAAQALLGDSTKTGVSKHLDRGFYTLLGHLNPVASQALSAVYTRISPAGMPGDDYMIMYDKRQTPQYQARDIARGMLAQPAIGSASGWVSALVNAAIPVPGAGSIVGGLLGQLMAKGASSALDPESFGGRQMQTSAPLSVLTSVTGGYILSHQNSKVYSLRKRAEQSLQIVLSKYGENKQVKQEVSEYLDELRSPDPRWAIMRINAYLSEMGEKPFVP